MKSIKIGNFICMLSDIIRDFYINHGITCFDIQPVNHYIIAQLQNTKEHC